MVCANAFEKSAADAGAVVGVPPPGSAPIAFPRQPATATIHTAHAWTRLPEIIQVLPPLANGGASPSCDG
jgi:hypothetical protein